jgi:superfamily II DNA or RNA helicase
MNMKLRDYQLESIAGLRKEFTSGKKRLILALTTGAGKTVVFSEMVRLAASKGTKTLVLTDRVELFKQTLKAIDRHGVPVQELKAGKKDFDIYALVTVAMVETLKRRNIPLYYPDLIIIDEAHKGNFTKVIDIFPDAKVIGATATPVGKHIPKLYSGIVQTIDTPDLIEQGYLAPCRAFQMQDDFSDLSVKAGEYTESSLFEHFNKQKLYAGVVQKWIEKTPGKKTIVFNVNIEHSEKMTDEFNAAGISSKCITSRTPKEERDKILAEFTSGAFPVLNNCGILTTGYDEPSIEVVIMNRKTKSLPLWLQCCGRGSRTYPGKTEFTVLDFGMNHDEHGLWEEPRKWSLEEKKKKKKGASQEAAVKTCKNCEAMVHARVMICPHCGYKFPETKAELVEGVLVEMTGRVPVELKGMKVSDLTLDELLLLQKTGKFKSSFIWRVARWHGHDFLVRYACKMGYKSGWIWNQEQKMDDCNFNNYTL